MVLGFTRPSVLLRVEGAAVLGGSLVLYDAIGASWWLFLLLLLAPDLSLFGYVAGGAIGAVVYNLVHTYVGPVVLFTGGFVAGSGTAMAIALAWAAHLGVDRAVGLGLKYPTGFRDTHLQRVR